METNADEQRRCFVRDYESGQWSMTELCQRYRVTRPTGYKWLERYEEKGVSGLEERSRAPATCPHQTPPALEKRIPALRAEYVWGAKKLLQVLERRHPKVAWPGIHGLCELNVWWMQLGIVHQRIRPASPQQNGQHERMHQDLKRKARTAAGREPGGPATQARVVPPPIQRRASPRPHRRSDPRGTLAPLAAAIPGAPQAPRLPEALGGAPRERRRHLPA